MALFVTLNHSQNSMHCIYKAESICLSVHISLTQEIDHCLRNIQIRFTHSNHMSDLTNIGTSSNRHCHKGNYSLVSVVEKLPEYQRRFTVSGLISIVG